MSSRPFRQSMLESSRVLRLLAHQTSIQMFLGESMRKIEFTRSLTLPSGASWIYDLPLLTDAQIKQSDNIHAARLGNLAYIDDMVGNIVAKLDSKGLLDNTYIIYTSDNGTKTSHTWRRRAYTSFRLSHWQPSSSCRQALSICSYNGYKPSLKHDDDCLVSCSDMFGSYANLEPGGGHQHPSAHSVSLNAYVTLITAHIC